ncbi:hypothetical protein NE237_025453 [Protea cynaroides]|uniref:Uncharacterized protein n=1 Tax=Protea cynaroides TaxID=273540 RepID=A0A9Q0H1X2_9MAGN|nr:hypothetical protein NE237_025453 [Protea cynaroides]
MEPDNRKPEALNEDKRVRLASASTENYGLRRAAQVRPSHEILILMTRPTLRWTPIQAKQGSSFLGQCLALIPNEERSTNLETKEKHTKKGEVLRRRGCKTLGRSSSLLLISASAFSKITYLQTWIKEAKG